MDILSNSEITFGSALHLLTILANGQFGPRDELFANLFKSYHVWRSAELGDCDFRTSPSLISSIIKNGKPLPRKFVFFYAQDHGSILRYDLDNFFKQAICTQRQKEIFFDRIITLVGNSANLAEKDKEFILQSTEINAVYEIWFRAFYVLILEPIDFAKVS